MQLWGLLQLLEHPIALVVGCDLGALGVDLLVNVAVMGLLVVGSCLG